MPALISSQGLSYSYSGKPVFNNLNFVIDEGERVALIGPNGAGKSTLIKILAQLLDADEGSLARKRDLTCGYVEQRDNLPAGRSVREYLDSARQLHTHTLGQESVPLESALQKITRDIQALPLESQIETLSGGQKKRVAILRELLRQAELVLLDEPTNHLDIDGIMWLEDLLLERVRSCIFISHDRYFIERVATRVVELDRRYPSGFLSAPGSYSDFLEAREAYLAALGSQQASLRNKVRRETEWLRQGAKARTTKAKYRIDEAHRLIAELNAIQLDERRSNLEFSESNRKTRELLKAEGVVKKYADRTIIKDLTLTLKPGVRVGIVGPNGAGKTTLLKLLADQLQPDYGSIRRASNLRTAVFGQAREALDLQVTLKQALADGGNSVVFNGREVHVVSWAKRFLFNPDQLNVAVGSLSGGEQARVLLAKMMRQAVDILFFDEPTNDLDIATLEVLEESFCEFPGAIVLVSHDRHLVDRVATSILGLSGASKGSDAGKVLTFADYTQWEISWRESHNLSSLSNKASANKVALNTQERKELASIERKLAKLDSQLGALKLQLADAKIATDPTALAAKWDQISKYEAESAQLLARWEELEQRN